MATKTVAFLGASTGVGYAALTATLAAGHNCIAMCRRPSKLTDKLPQSEFPNLQVIEGNAHDGDAVRRLITAKNGRLVDQIVFTIGGAFDFWRFTIDDPEVCRNGMSTLLAAIDRARNSGSLGKPHILVCSTTGISKFGRDVPLLMVPLYHILLKVPHADKEIMESRLWDSGENFTIVRASLLTDGDSETPIRVGIEDPKTGRESSAIGYTISREDAGKWIANNVVLEPNSVYLNKIAMITY